LGDLSLSRSSLNFAFPSRDELKVSGDEGRGLHFYPYRKIQVTSKIKEEGARVGHKFFSSGP
jgi:hypothetical protein